jgi:hypothetical protein
MASGGPAGGQTFEKFDKHVFLDMKKWIQLQPFHQLWVNAMARSHFRFK